MVSEISNGSKENGNVTIFIKEEKRNLIAAYARSCGQSLNGYINQAIEERMTRDEEGFL